MKRTTLFILTVLMAVCARAQFETVVTAGIKDIAGVSERYYVAYNFESVCQSMDVKSEEFGHILEVWLDSYRVQRWPNEYARYESQKFLYLITTDGRQVKGVQHKDFNLGADGNLAGPDNEHWVCKVSLDRARNRLNFEFIAGYEPHGTPRAKEGDTYHYTFGMEYQGKRATFNVTFNVVPEFSGNSIALASLEKVGAQDVKLKYQAGKTGYRTYLNTSEIAKQFGGNVKGGNLAVYITKKNDRQTLTDRYAYQRDAEPNLDERLGENFNYSGKRAIRLLYLSQTGELLVHPKYEGNYEDGEHVAGPVYLVADGKYYELNVDLQIGDSEQETRNMAVVEAAEQCGSFARSLTVAPESGAGSERKETMASFSLPVLAKALGTDGKTLGEALKTWIRGNDREDGTEMIYNLTDHASTQYSWGCGSYRMTKYGCVVKTGGDYMWIMDVDDSMNELQFNLWQEFGQLADGDVCNTDLGLYYEGRMVTLSLILYMKQGGRGSQVPLSGMKKVGEQVISGKCDAITGMRVPLALDSIAALFGSGVPGKSLKLYVMDDPKKGLLNDRFSYEKTPYVCLNIEGTSRVNYKTREYFNVKFSPYQEVMLIDAYTDVLCGGQKTSASLFLVGEDEYYELVLDIQFGEETDERESFDIVATEHLDVQLMPTNNNYTYYDRENNSYALISTAIDEARLAEQLGTESPMLYTEQRDNSGNITFTSRYNCVPGQGFWFGLRDGKAHRGIHSEIGYLGVYYADGAFKWYEEPYPPLKVGEKFCVTLYMANVARSTAVKYEIDVEIVEGIETPSVAYVHRLPADLTWNANGIEAIHNAECIMQNETDAVYDLQGRRLNAVPEKGLYIQGRRKKMK